MPTFSVRFLGCKVSQTDAHELREELARRGHREGAGASQVAVVNTCCVTHEAVRKSRQAARRAARRSEAVYVTGCAARLAGDAFRGGLPENVHVVAAPPEEAAARVGSLVGDLGCVGPEPRRDRVRAFVKIQDGCSFGCSFCVIPRVRGATRSRDAAAVLREIEQRVAQGHPEVVLTGINLGLYRDREARVDLPRLIRLAGALPGLRRLRLSSIEVNHLTTDLVAALRETTVAARHLHVPLQSGDDAVLAAMRRRYDVATYLRRVRLADGFNLTSDVIVGFPTEDERAFEATLETVARAGITKVHVFPYSPRPDTLTERDDPVPPVVKKERSARLRAAARAAERRGWARKVGADDLVLVDRPGRGYGDDYSPWLVEAPVGSLVRARATDVSDEGVIGVAA
jgi:threonylcarbamoyladenosine tRNA methylthiotransferase MtaB